MLKILYKFAQELSHTCGDLHGNQVEGDSQEHNMRVVSDDTQRNLCALIIKRCCSEVEDVEWMINQMKGFSLTSLKEPVKQSMEGDVDLDDLDDDEGLNQNLTTVKTFQIDGARVRSVTHKTRRK